MHVGGRARRSTHGACGAEQHVTCGAPLALALRPHKHTFQSNGCPGAQLATSLMKKQPQLLLIEALACQQHARAGTRAAAPNPARLPRARRPLPAPPPPRAPAAVGLVFLPSFFAFVILDVIWITFVGKDVYAGLRPILKENPDTAAALLSWMCIVLGNYIFVLPRTGGGRPAWHVIGQVRCWGGLRAAGARGAPGSSGRGGGRATACRTHRSRSASTSPHTRFAAAPPVSGRGLWPAAVR